ncbi:hypothetical protein GCM10009837_26300 [Streptomyces durmitorensis]|uniref:Uncharacterized protein n=1 Tax=Streptomyces durmitorensis TaxID=319947 RepID=A0ABY4PUT4_9ACTN|nr:hypothetical protein [Streptomyces durmitorensis]UQT56709.1 hypothetical protein M4V62_17285 [Streptomyces durmitorensis]
MRDRIARALTWALSVLAPRRPGRHSAAFLADHAEPTPTSVSPWARPWTGPTKEEAAAFFRQQSESTMELALIRERRRAAVLATMGVDYPYSYPGAPFGPSAFAAVGVSA